MDSYQEVIERLFAKRNRQRRSDLKIFEKLSRIFDNPHKNYPTIHIAGTNGKGSVVTKIAAALQAAGWKTGLYTSPHLFAYEERISIDGKNISKQKIIEKEKIIGEKIKNWQESPNFFEITTAMAFSYFSDEKVDVAVVETGLGGKLDATNIIDPILTIITSISFDHMEILGNSLEKIAAEKAGIIKRNIPLVLGPRAQFQSIINQAKKLSAPIYSVDKNEFFIEENRAIVRQALALLTERFSLEKKHIDTGLQKNIPCRFEKRGDIIFDVAHNADGFAALIKALKHSFPKKSFRFVIGISEEKEINACLTIIAQIAKAVHFVQSKFIASACTPEKLGKEFALHSSCPYFLEKSVEEGLKNAISIKAADELIIVCGSFYIMKQAFSVLDEIAKLGSSSEF